MQFLKVLVIFMTAIAAIISGQFMAQEQLSYSLVSALFAAAFLFLSVFLVDAHPTDTGFFKDKK